MKTLEPLLAAHPFFKHLAPRHVELLTGCAKNVRFNAGDWIFREGQPAQDFYILRHGKVAVEIFSPNRGSVVVQTLHEGDVLGWSWLVPPYRWHFDARAIDLTRAISLDGECLRKKCEEDCELGYHLLKQCAGVISERLQATRMQILDVYGS